MQAVILAAGRGTRMGGLTESAPKGLLRVAKKTLLEYEFDSLPEEVDEIILVVGYRGDMIREHFGSEYRGKRIVYVEQEVLDGTAGALWRAKDILKNRFIVMMGDDLYSRNDISQCLSATNVWALLVQEIPKMGMKGKVESDALGNIIQVKEGNNGDQPGFVSKNLFVLDTRIFDCPLVPKAAGNEEYGLPQTAIAAATRLGLSFKAVTGENWIQINGPEDLKQAEGALKKTGLMA